jgi:hypothetical protein
MPIFMVERQFAEKLEADSEAIAALNRINDEEGIRWLHSFLSQDLRKTYCLYEAPNVGAIRVAAARAGIPADAIIELTGRLESDGAVNPIS